MKFDQVFKPMEIAPDVDEPVRASYAATAEELVRITRKQVAIESRRQELRVLGVTADSAAIDEMRGLSGKLIELLREELEVRAGKLAPWFDRFRDEISSLDGRLIEQRKRTDEDVRSRLATIGYSASDITPGLVAKHPDVRAIDERRGRLERLRMALSNPQSNALGFRPAKENADRIDQIHVALKSVSNAGVSPIEQAAFV